MATIDVHELTDSELRKKIKELGKDVGPITKTTRPIWEKRLIKLLAENNGTEVSEPKKERRKSAGRSTTVTASRSSSRSKTPPRTSNRGKKLAMFSSDEELEEASVRSVQTSPVGFPSPTVSLTSIIDRNKTTDSSSKITATASPAFKKQIETSKRRSFGQINTESASKRKITTSSQVGEEP